jgi:hypothetical protein
MIMQCTVDTHQFGGCGDEIGRHQSPDLPESPKAGSKSQAGAGTGTDRMLFERLPAHFVLVTGPSPSR